MNKAIFFDLDGTLLELHTEQFVQNYLKELGAHVGKHYDAKQILASVWDATKAMIMSQDPEKTNEEVFIEHFVSHSGIKKEEIWPIFDEFYNDVFPGLSHYSNPSPWAKQIVEAAKERGYTIAVTTNPVFPRSAIYSRLAWIGLSPEDFEWVTVYEEAHHTKPSLAYYQEVCTQLQLQPEQVIMVGNHMQEDMVASKLGMKTFLVTNYLEDRGEPVYDIDQKGSIEELYQSIKNGTGVFA